MKIHVWRAYNSGSNPFLSFFLSFCFQVLKIYGENSALESIDVKWCGTDGYDELELTVWLIVLYALKKVTEQPKREHVQPITHSFEFLARPNLRFFAGFFLSILFLNGMKGEKVIHPAVDEWCLINPFSANISRVCIFTSMISLYFFWYKLGEFV